MTGDTPTPAVLTVELGESPAVGPLFRSAAIGMLPGLRTGRASDELPGLQLVLRGVTTDRDRLAAYHRVCGFRLTDTLPATWPHILAFGLSMRLMTAPEFPFPLIGLVHLANRITVERPVDAGEPLDLAVRTVDLRPHPRGRQFDVVATASVDGEVVWRDTSTYLRREKPVHRGPERGSDAAGGTAQPERTEPRERPAPPPASARWRLTPRVGRDYARVSGDHNPIHTSRLGARLLGFPRPIAHGMYSKARCLAALEGRLPEAYTVDVAFKLPVPLPGTVAFSARRTGDGAGAGWDLGLHDARTGRPHLAGTIR